MDRVAGPVEPHKLKCIEDDIDRSEELAREIAVREKYRRESWRYAFDRLASRIVRDARPAFSRRRNQLQTLRAFAIGLGLGVFGLAALGAAGLLGPKPEAPQRIWITANNPHDGDPVALRAGSRFSLASPRCVGSSSEQGALASAALHKATARPQYLGGGRSDQSPPGTAAPTHPAAVSMTPSGGGASRIAFAGGEYSK